MHSFTFPKADTSTRRVGCLLLLALQKAMVLLMLVTVRLDSGFLRSRPGWEAAPLYILPGLRDHPLIASNKEPIHLSDDTRFAGSQAHPGLITLLFHLCLYKVIGTG